MAAAAAAVADQNRQERHIGFGNTNAEELKEGGQFRGGASSPPILEFSISQRTNPQNPETGHQTGQNAEKG